jgi:hypothetical protein
MIVMLGYLYGIDYENIWDDHIRDPCLVSHAGVYVVAEKYQAPKLKEEAYENFLRILGPKPRYYEYGKRPLREYNFIDFPVALHMIHAGTKPGSKVRPLMMHACTASLDKLEAIPNFWTLLNELPDLAVEIIKHQALPVTGIATAKSTRYGVLGSAKAYRRARTVGLMTVHILQTLANRTSNHSYTNIATRMNGSAQTVEKPLRQSVRCVNRTFDGSLRS